MSADAIAILEEMKDHPVVVELRWMLVAIGGMSDSAFGDHVAKFRKYFLDEYGWFYHDTIGYHAAYFLVPAQLRDAYPASTLIPLKNQIHCVLDQYFHHRTFEPSRVQEVREAISQKVDEWVSTNPRKV